MALKLRESQLLREQAGEIPDILLAQEVLEVCNGVVGVADEEVLGLAAVVLVTVDVRQYGRYLSV